MSLFKRKPKGEVGRVWGIKLIMTGQDIARLKTQLEHSRDGERIPDWVEEDLRFMNEQLNGKYNGVDKTIDSAWAIFNDYLDKFHP